MSVQHPAGRGPRARWPARGPRGSAAEAPDSPAGSGDPVGARHPRPARTGRRPAATGIAVIGAGAAGLTLVDALTAPGRLPAPPVVLIEATPGPLRPPPRTWCFWQEGAGRYDAAVGAAWQRLRLHDAAGRAVERDIAPLRYKMVRSDDFEALVSRRLAARPGVRRLTADVDAVAGLPGGGAEVRATAADGSPVTVRARWVYDSRPPDPLPAGRTGLLQHFRGWFVRTDRPRFETGTVELMDFRTRRPAHGLSFGYVLPTGPCTALVEYTEFSRRLLDDAAYEEALGHYCREVLRLGGFSVRARETGAIPMTDAPFVRRAGPAVFRIGTAGGATRPSTGYTFATIQRQSLALARAVRAGRSPVPPRPHPARARAMDAVLLRALDSGRIDGPEFFVRLFRRVPPGRLLRFLDGRSTLAEELAIGARVPVLPMLHCAAELPLLPRRTPPGPRTPTRPRHGIPEGPEGPEGSGVPAGPTGPEGPEDCQTPEVPAPQEEL
ncbi:lycopene cyclase [Streptomyces sp. NHF165]|uniref:lycopene cyclase family protein n=1 Tax=Streptomyces sp. NHF165 TaxID=2175864 RepID=UPI00132EE371|nr:lycopene cyclase family protein [Streptomyces sp. NHF165]QHF94708.1 lycopene cyclase [Streptomyces sp. NHF165]